MFSDDFIASAIDAAPDIAAPDGDEGTTGEWSEAILTHGGGADASVTELRDQRSARGRGPQKTPKKVLLSMRFSPEVMDAFRASGPGWQTRMDDALRDWLKEHSPVS